MRDPEEKGPDGTTIKDRMQGLIEKIAKDIEEAGSACDHYMKKGFLGLYDAFPCRGLLIARTFDQPKPSNAKFTRGALRDTLTSLSSTRRV